MIGWLNRQLSARARSAGPAISHAQAHQRVSPSLTFRKGKAMSRSFSGILFDLDGVLVTGGNLLPGAMETLHALRDAEIPFLILSSMTLAPRAAVLDRFRHAGLDLPLDAMLTPPAATAR